MKNIGCRGLICAVLVCVFAVSGLSACSNSQGANVQQETSAAKVTEAVSAGGSAYSTVSASAESTTVPTPVPTPALNMTKEQQNSINMLNYLTVLVQEIQRSKNSRLYLESAYSELLNNTEPSIVDELTLDEYEKILTIIENYRMITVQRERLQYIYEQNRASALRMAMPNPLSILNIVQSGNPLHSITSLIFAAVDSVNSYNTYTQDLDLQYLQDGWSLDDAEAANLHDSRTSMFSYMVRMSRDLPAGITLSEEAVNEFVEWENKDNITSRIHWLESNQKTYRFFGEYWLVLAGSYYNNGDWEKCLDAIAAYEELDNSIFRKDIRFAQTLPCAIVSAQEILDGDEYTQLVARYAQLIVDNTNNDDWALRYFAAQAYVQLYAQTDDLTYLQSAYDLAYDNVNELIPRQYELNDIYLADVEEATASKDAEKEEKKTIKAYNKLLKETRETELPPVYEPLRLNCELLLALADQLDISLSQRTDIDKILHPNGERLFLNVPLDAQFYFASETLLDVNDISAEYADGKIMASEITIPAEYVPDGASVTVTIAGTGETQTYADWTLEEVDRKKSDAPEDFVAVFNSGEAKGASFADGDLITVSIVPPAGQDDIQAVTIKFQVHRTDGFLGTSSLEFERVST